jgi:hypothetical protein
MIPLYNHSKSKLFMPEDPAIPTFALGVGCGEERILPSDSYKMDQIF